MKAFGRCRSGSRRANTPWRRSAARALPRTGFARSASSLPRSSAITFGPKRSANSAMNSSRALAMQRSVLRAAIARVQKQRAQLAVPGVIVAEEERRRGGVDAELARRVHLRADVIVVPGLGQPDRRLDRADADDVARRRRRPGRRRSTRPPSSASRANDAIDRSMRAASRSALAGSVVSPAPVRSDSASSAGRSSRAIGRT